MENQEPIAAETTTVDDKKNQDSPNNDTGIETVKEDGDGENPISIQPAENDPAEDNTKSSNNQQQKEHNETTSTVEVFNAGIRICTNWSIVMEEFCDEISHAGINIL